jgi:hypothetical protein
MKQGSHIMLQRLVRSTVRTAPRPYLIVDVPWFRRRLFGERKQILDAGAEREIGRHQVFDEAVLRTRLGHQQKAVAGFDLRPYLAGLALDEHAHVGFPGKDRIASLFHAPWTERVGLTRPAERRESSLASLEQRRGRPFGVGRRLLEALVVRAHHGPDCVGERLKGRAHAGRRCYFE